MYLSIILPIYKVEDYITNCLDSLLFKQDLDNSFYEIVAVNDGTPDNSMIIVQQYAEKYDNIRVINKENGGVSSARNEGICHATGDFIFFVDPDDVIAENSLKKIYDFLLLNSLTEILVMRSFSNNNTQEYYAWKSFCTINTAFTGVDCFQKGYLRGSVCGCGFQRRFLNEKTLFFVSGIINGEDSLFFNIAFLYAIDVFFLDLPFYYVTIREDGASRFFTLERIFNYSNNILVIENYLETHVELSGQQKAVLNYSKYTVISNAVYQFIKTGRYNWYLLKSKLMHKNTLPIDLKYISVQRLKIRLLNFSFFLYFILSKIKNICKK